MKHVWKKPHVSSVRLDIMSQMLTGHIIAPNALLLIVQNVSIILVCATPAKMVILLHSQTINVKNGLFNTVVSCTRVFVLSAMTISCLIKILSALLRPFHVKSRTVQPVNPQTPHHVRFVQMDILLTPLQKCVKKLSCVTFKNV